MHMLLMMLNKCVFKNYAREQKYPYVLANIYIKQNA